MRTASFPRAVRLLSKAGFDSAFGGVRRQSDWFTAHVRVHAGAQPRLGLAIGRRVSKRAVERNLLKRLVREAFRHIAASLPICDIVVTAKPGAASATRADLRCDLDRLFRRVTALKPAAATGTILAPDLPSTPPERASPPTD
jgi:ribonuclease P protein component